MAFDRSNGLPLDQWSVFQTKAKAEEYLTNAKAYPGQVIAYADDNGEMVACVLSQNADGSALVLKQIGIIPTGDNKTVEVSATGEITLKGAAGATAGQQPRIVNKGTAEAPKLELEWYTPDNSTVSGLQETVGALSETVNGVVAEDGSVTKEGLTHKVAALDTEIGVKAAEGVDATGLYKEIDDALEAAKAYADGKEHKNTTYELTQEGMVLTLTPSEGEADVVTIDAYNKKEIDDKFAALPEDKDTTYTAKADDKVLKLTGTEFSTELGLKHENGKISLTGIGGAVIAEFSDADFIADGVLEDVSYDATKKELTFTWNIKDDQGNFKTDIVPIGDLVDTYTAGNGLELTNAQFSVKIDDASEGFLTVGADGVKLAGVQEAINAAKTEALNGNAVVLAQAQAYTDSAKTAAETKAGELADAAEAAAIEEAGKLADAAKQAAITDAAGKYATTDALNDVKKTAEDAVTAEEMASHVTDAIKDKVDSATLNNYYTQEQTDAKIAAAVKPADDKLKDIEAGAQVNKIEVIKVNGTEQSITDKAVDITVPTDVANLTDVNHKYVTKVEMRKAEGYTPWISATQAEGVVVISDEAVQTTVNDIKATANTAVQTAEFAGAAMTKTGTKLSIAQADA